MDGFKIDNAETNQELGRCSMEDVMRIENIFTYHPPKGNQTERYECIRNKAKYLAMVITALCPSSRERSLALTKLEEAVFWANAAIARNEEAVFWANAAIARNE